MLSELGGPFGFGLAAFTMIIAANQILNLGRLVSNDRVSLFTVVGLFFWQLPSEIVLVIPMACLLGTLLAMQRLSSESEITAMKAAGIGFLRIVAPLLGAGILISFLMYALQEGLVPYANARVTEIENVAINHTSAFSRDLTVVAPLPGGGRQVTIAAGYDPNSAALLHVTLVQYDRNHVPTQIVFADRAEFLADRWTLENSSVYRFNPDGTTVAEPSVAEQQVQIGENPTDIVKRISNDDPESMSRSQIASIVRTGQLTENELRKYVTTYQEKLAQPLACFVFILIAIPFGVGALRGGGNVSIGFGLAVLIIFVYYIVMTVCSYIGEAFLPLAWLWAWMPNIIFTGIGLSRIRKVATR